MEKLDISEDHLFESRERPWDIEKGIFLEEDAPVSQDAEILQRRELVLLRTSHRQDVEGYGIRTSTCSCFGYR